MSRLNSSLFSKLARVGYASKSCVYFTLGGMSLIAGFNRGDKPADSVEALRTIFEQSHGKFLLGALIISIFCYVLWRLGQAFLDLEHKGNHKKGIAIRAIYFLSAVAYGAVGTAACRMLLGMSHSQGGDAAAQSVTATLMAQPLGRILVVVLGLAFLAAGIVQAVIGYKQKFSEQLDFRSLSQKTRKGLCRVCSFGFYARGVVFALMGAFFIWATLEASSQEAHGFAGTLLVVRQQPYGPWLLAIVAAGLVAYGLYCLVQVFYRRKR